MFPQQDLWASTTQLLSALQTQSYSIRAAGSRSISNGCDETVDTGIENLRSARQEVRFL